MALAAFVDEVVARVKETPVDLALLAPEAIPGSIFSGAAGVAFFLHEVARLRGDEGALRLARRWCEAARGWAARASNAQWNDTPSGFIVGEGGLSYVEALVGAREGDRERAIASLARFAEISTGLFELARPDTEYMGGAAGLVLAARDLDARLPPDPGYAAARDALGRVRDRAIDLLLAKYASPLALASRDMFGFAHGPAGELWALVTTVGADHAIVRARLAELAALRELDEEDLVYWRMSPADADTDLLGSWCNGMAGHLLLWAEVARQTRSSEAIAFSGKCAESASILLNGTPTVCCGMAGHAMALQKYADVVGDRKAAKLAYRRLTGAIPLAAAGQRSFFLSLFQGTLGIALVAMARLGLDRSVALVEPLNERA